jgi:hypothetical protein
VFDGIKSRLPVDQFRTRLAAAGGSQVNLLRIDEKRSTVREKREENAVHCKSGNKIFKAKANVIDVIVIVVTRPSRAISASCRI